MSQDPGATIAATLLLAHGAGAPMDSPWLLAMDKLLGERGVAVARFEFGYMAARRSGGGRPAPPRAEKLTGEFRAAIAALQSQAPVGPLLIGGKSMGGRVASLIADDLHEARTIAGLVCLGYPLHPPGKPEALRFAHLETMAVPALIVQGERDPFGTRAEFAALSWPPAIRVHWVADGDHDLKPRGGKDKAAAALAGAADAVAAFARTVSGPG